MLGQHQFSCVSALPGLPPGELTNLSVHDFIMVYHCPCGNAELLSPYLTVKPCWDSWLHFSLTLVLALALTVLSASAYLAWYKAYMRSRIWQRKGFPKSDMAASQQPVLGLIYYSGTVVCGYTYGFLWPWWNVQLILAGVLIRCLRDLPCEDQEWISPLPNRVWDVATGKLSSPAIPILSCCLCQFFYIKRNSEELTSL